MKSIENKNTANNGALSGILVLDLSRLLPGPFCSMILADHGARVISVEDKRFLSDDFFISEVNRNKEHMSLNLKTREGKEIFFRLVIKRISCWRGFDQGLSTDSELTMIRFATSIQKLFTVPLQDTVKADPTGIEPGTM